MDVTTADAGTSAAAPAPQPIGGLLWIPAVFLVLITLGMFGTVAKSMRSAMEVLVATPARGFSVSPVVAAIQIVNVVVSLFVLIKFFQRRRYIPLLIIAFALFNGVAAIGLSQALPPRAILLALVSTALLVSYFSLSKRVKRTFLL